MDYEAEIIEEVYVDYLDGYAPAQSVEVSYRDYYLVITKCKRSMQLWGGFLYLPFKVCYTNVIIES